MMKKIIAIVAGGDSGEYDISIQSAEVVKEYLDKELYEAFIIGIRDNVWKYTDAEGGTHFINRKDFSLTIDDREIAFDAVFIAIHGTPGEDGKLQGYFDMLKIPYTSCNQMTSAITFNKFFCSRIVSSFNVPTSPSVILYKEDDIHTGNITDAVGFPCFVKPNGGGSSVGMSRVDKPEQLIPAIHKAFNEDDQVLVERFISGREITCGVLTVNGTVRSLPITEVITKNDFFDFEAKYTDGMAQEITPADVEDEIAKQCRSTSEMLYKNLNCRGVVRFDYIFNESGIYFLEVNTVPGLSPNSIVPQQSAAEGISLKELFTIVLDQALEK